MPDNTLVCQPLQKRGVGLASLNGSSSVGKLEPSKRCQKPCRRPDLLPNCAQFFHPPDPPIAGQSISRDVPLARARAFRFSIPLFEGVAKAAYYSAHRTSTFLSCAFCEQEGHLAAPSHSSATARCASKGSNQVAPSVSTG